MAKENEEQKANQPVDTGSNKPVAVVIDKKLVLEQKEPKVQL